MKQGKLSELVQFPLSIYQLKVRQVNKATTCLLVNISLYMLMIKPKPTVPSVCKPCLKNAGGLGQQKKITVL